MALRKDLAMFAAYLVAILAILISGGSALTLFYTVSHFDPPESSSSRKPAGHHVAV